MSKAKNDLNWFQAKVTKPFNLGRAFEPGEIIRVSEDIRFVDPDCRLPRDPIKVHNMYTICDECGIYYFVTPTRIRSAVELAIEISGKYGLVPVGSVSTIDNFERFFVPIDEESQECADPWDKLDSGDYLIYTSDSNIFHGFFTKGNMYPVFGKDIIKSAGELPPIPALLIGGDDHKPHKLRIHMPDGTFSLKDFFKIPGNDETNDSKEIEKPDVSITDSVMYFLTVYNKHTPLSEMLKHLPSNIEDIHTLDDAVFRIVCGVGNVDGVQWFMNNYNCEIFLDLPWEHTINTSSPTSPRFCKAFGLSSNDIHEIQMSSSLMKDVGTYYGGFLRDPVQMILVSGNLHAIDMFICNNTDSVGAIKFLANKDLFTSIIRSCLDCENEYSVATRARVLSVLMFDYSILRQVYLEMDCPDEEPIKTCLWEKFLKDCDIK